MRASNLTFANMYMNQRVASKNLTNT